MSKRNTCIEQLEARQLFSQGPLDPTFGTGGIQSNLPSVYGPSGGNPPIMAMDAQGRILVATTAGTGGGPETVVTRLNANGSVDSGLKTFEYNPSGTGSPYQSVNQILPESNGGILLLGAQVQLLSSSGVLNPSFSNPLFSERITAVAGVLLAGGKFMVVDGSTASVYQFNANGSPDSTFGNDGVLILSSPYKSMALQDIVLNQSGLPVVSFSAQQSTGATMGAMIGGTLRLTTTGNIDTAYGSNGFAVAPLQNASSIATKIVLAPDGTVDQLVNATSIFAYSNNGKQIGGGDDMTANLNAIAVGSDGKLVAVGSNSHGGAVVDRFDAISPGAAQPLVYDASFYGSGSLAFQTVIPGTDTTGDSVLIDVSGRIVTAVQRPFNQDGPLAVARILPDAGNASDSFQVTGKPIGTAGSWHGQGNTISKVFDGNLSTFFDSPNANGGWVGLDLGTAQVIASISFAPRPGWNGRMIGGMFQGSSTADFSAGVQTLYTVTTAPPVGQLITVGIGDAGPFRYVRYIGPTGGYCNIAEMEMFAGPQQLTGTPIGTDGSYKSLGNTLQNVFDGQASTFFDAPTASGSWVGVDLGSAQVVQQVSFAPRVGWTARMVGGEIQASNSANFSCGVVTLYTITTAPTAGVLTTASLNKTAAYRYYRYLGPANSYCNIAELELFG